MSNRPTKIFGIGLSKTGTSSLAQALQRLGFRTKDCMGAARYVAGDLSSIDIDTILAHDALTDTPIPSFYRELDARFPGSKFILTVRERSGWLQSCKKQFNARSAAAQNDAHRRLFQDLYGTNAFDTERFANGYERFVAGVQEHFKDRPQDLLIMNVTAGDGWEKLCPFLGKPIPDTPFPKANVTSIRWMNVEDLVAIAEAAGYELLKRHGGSIDPEARDVTLPAQRLDGFLDKAMRLAFRRDPAEAAAKAALRVIVSRLRKLNPGIAVVSPLDQPPPFAVRKKWNHVWMVDPLDGREAFDRGSGEFSVNLALIEDGRPIYGVVHAPTTGSTYFGRVGKGAFKRTHGGSPTRLPASTVEGTAFPQGTGDSSRGLALCMLLEQADCSAADCGTAPEWRVAAAHAVLAAADLRAVQTEPPSEPAYNSPHLTVGPLSFEASEPA